MSPACWLDLLLLHPRPIDRVDGAVNGDSALDVGKRAIGLVYCVVAAMVPNVGSIMVSHVAEAFTVIRLSEDEAGESHFSTFEEPLLLNNFAPPALPFYVSKVHDAQGYTAIRIPIGWSGVLHRSPHRQILFCLAGALRVAATDGTVRTVSAGDVWLMEDNAGKGHESEVVSPGPFDAVIILIPA